MHTLAKNNGFRNSGIRVAVLAVSLGLATLGVTSASVVDSAPARAEGSRIIGSTDSAGAPEIKDGLWADELPQGEATKYYRVKRTQPGSTFWAGISMIAPVNPVSIEANWLLPESPNNEEEDCGTYSSMISSSGGKLARDYLSTQLMSEDTSEEACNTADELLLAIEVGESSDTANSPFQIKLYEEPPIENRADLPGEADDPSWEPMEAGNPSDITAAPTMTQAPSVKSGTYRTTIRPGEKLFLKVDADWGQRIQVSNRAQTGDIPGGAQPNSNSWGTGILSPLGGVTNMTSSDAPKSNYGSLYGVDNLTTAIMRPIRVDNRSTSTDRPALAGSFYIMLYLDKSSTDEPSFDLPLEVTVAVLGEPNGQPRYAGSNSDQKPDDFAGGSGSGGGQLLMITGLAAGIVVLIGAAIGGLVWLRRSMRS